MSNSLDNLTKKILAWDEQQTKAEAAALAGRPAPLSIAERKAAAKKQTDSDPKIQAMRAKNERQAKDAALGAKVRRIQQQQELVEAAVNAFATGMEETEDGEYINPAFAQATINLFDLVGPTEEWVEYLKQQLGERVEFDYDGIDQMVDESALLYAKRWGESQQAANAKAEQQQAQSVQDLATSIRDRWEGMVKLNPHVNPQHVTEMIEHQMQERQIDPSELTADIANELIDTAFRRADFIAEQFAAAEAATKRQKGQADQDLVTEDAKDDRGEPVTRKQKHPVTGEMYDVPIREPFLPDLSDEAWANYLAPTKEEVAAELEPKVEKLFADSEAALEKQRTREEIAAHNRRGYNLRKTGCASGNPADPAYNPNGETARAARSAYAAEFGEDALKAELEGESS